MGISEWLNAQVVKLDNKRYFYQLDGEGIRYELVTFLKSIEFNKNLSYISADVTIGIAGVLNDFESGKDMTTIKL